MPSEIQIHRYSGYFAEGQWVDDDDITYLNTAAGSDDFHDEDPLLEALQVEVPVADTNYSYWVTTGLVRAGESLPTTLTSIIWYTNTTGPHAYEPPAGIRYIVGQTNTYEAAFGDPGVTGSPLSDRADPLDDEDDASVYTELAPLSVVGASAPEESGMFGNFVVFQLEVDHDTAAIGVTDEVYFHWAVDEI